MNTKLPWYLRQSLLGGKSRHPTKLPKFVFAFSGYAHRGNPHDSRIPSLSGVPGIDNAEYRFWMGTKTEHSQCSTCRACGRIVFSRRERELHGLVLKEPACTVRLTTAYGILLVRGECVVCGKNVPKKERMWGVPMCRIKCVDDWKFNLTRPKRLLDALQEADKILMKRDGSTTPAQRTYLQ